MKQPLNNALTAKQRLAVSRHALKEIANEPIWGSFLRWCIRRCVSKLDRQGALEKPLCAKWRLNPEASGHILS